jgi:hypothetical protein
MLNRHTPKSHCSKDKENPIASISYRSEGIESTTLSEGDYKGENEPRYFNQLGKLAQTIPDEPQPSGLVYVNFDEHRKSSQSDCLLDICPIH